MIKYKINIGEKENEILKDIFLDCMGGKTKRLCLRIVSCFAVIYILLETFLFDANDDGSINYMSLALAAIFVWLAIFARKIQELMFYIKSSKITPEKKQGVREYVFSEGGIKVSSLLSSSMNSWATFSSWGYYKNYIYIVMPSKGFLLVSLNDLSVNEINDLTNLLKRHLSFCPN